MKQFYAFFLISWLAAAGCKKHEPEPEFQGRWEWIQSQSSVFNPDGTFGHADAPNTPTSAGAQQLTVSGDSMVTRTVNGYLRYRYARSGQMLALTGNANYSLRIQELTGSRLVLAFEEHYSAAYGGGVGRQVLSEYSR